MKQQKILYWSLLFILTIIGGFVRVYKSKRLNGWQQAAQRPTLNAKEVLQGSFQQQFEPFWNDKSTFHNDFVRIRNQIYYSLFNVVVNDKIIAGRNNYFYESGYIYNIYSRYGVHYNKYGAYLVIDSLSKYFHKVFPNMPSVVLDSGSYDYDVWSSEHDCFEASNLFTKEKKEKLYHPYFHCKKSNTYNNDEKEIQPNITECIFIGDSYMWPLKDLGFDKDFFDFSQFWYYGQEVSYSQSAEKKTIEQIDIKEELSKTDAIIILFTNATTLDADNGFIDKVYNLYFNNN